LLSKPNKNIKINNNKQFQRLIKKLKAQQISKDGRKQSYSEKGIDLEMQRTS